MVLFSMYVMVINCHDVNREPLYLSINTTQLKTSKFAAIH